jgi:hypothetical protein
VQRRIFGPRREEVIGGWKRLHNKELHYLYTSPNIIRVNEIDMACSMDGRDDKYIENFGQIT